MAWMAGQWWVSWIFPANLEAVPAADLLRIHSLEYGTSKQLLHFWRCAFFILSAWQIINRTLQELLWMVDSYQADLSSGCPLHGACASLFGLVPVHAVDAWSWQNARKWSPKKHTTHATHTNNIRICLWHSFPEGTSSCSNIRIFQHFQWLTFLVFSCNVRPYPADVELDAKETPKASKAWLQKLPNFCGHVDRAIGKVPSLLENVKLRAVPNTVLPAAQSERFHKKMRGGKGSFTSPKSGKVWQPEKYNHLCSSHCVLLCFHNLLKVVPPRSVWLHMSATKQRCKLCALCLHHGFNSLKVQLRRIAWCLSPTILRQFQRWWGPWWVTCLMSRVWWVTWEGRVHDDYHPIAGFTVFNGIRNQRFGRTQSSSQLKF